MLWIRSNMLNVREIRQKKFDENEGGWEERMESRKEIWELRREAEVQKYQAEQEEAERAATLGEDDKPEGENCNPN